MSDRPLFIDPVGLADGEVDEASVPVWFRLLAVALLTIAIYYLGSFLSGPRLSSPHNFVPGRAVYEEATGSAEAP